VLSGTDRVVARRFSARLRAWFKRHGRALPWRDTRDPYRILVSELMLQQTQVARVVGFYERFLDRFPDVQSLAAAPPRMVREAWDGLGYYARARNLHTLARAVTRDGRGELPAEPNELLELPGIGPYTAHAVATFAHERRSAPVDTNVARVVARAFAPHLQPKRARDLTRLRELAYAILPRTGKAAWAHNQGLMELGALVCTARVAKCGECPVRQDCKTGQRSRAKGLRSKVGTLRP
jgi:A/G-specific adenine glycosylase